jgi:hypothetical protein
MNQRPPHEPSRRFPQPQRLWPDFNTINGEPF